MGEGGRETSTTKYNIGVKYTCITNTLPKPLDPAEGNGWCLPIHFTSVSVRTLCPKSAAFTQLFLYRYLYQLLYPRDASERTKKTNTHTHSLEHRSGLHTENLPSSRHVRRARIRRGQFAAHGSLRKRSVAAG